MFKKIFSFFLIISLIWLFYWALFVPKESLTLKISKELQKQTKKIDLMVKGVLLTETIGETKIWQIRAVDSQINKDMGIAVLSQVQGIIFSQNKPYLNFDSPLVNWDLKKQLIKINTPTGSDKNYKFSMPFIEWYLKEDKFFSEGDIRFFSKNAEISGNKLTGFLSQKSVFLNEKPIAQFRKGKDTLTLKAESFEIDGGNGNILAKKNCSITMNGLKILADNFVFVRKSNFVKAQGNVVFSYKDIFAKCEKISYLFGSADVILEGNVLATRASNTMRATRLKVNLKSNKIIMEGKTEVYVEDEEMELKNDN